MDQEVKKIFRPLLLVGLLVFIFAAIFYLIIHAQGGQIPFLRCLYMVIITISTVGYEDQINSKDSTLLTIVNIGVILTCMVAVAYSVSNFTAFLVEGRVTRYFLLKKNLKRVRKMRDHYIICGIKNIGLFAARELAETRRSLVVIDDNPAALDQLHKSLPDVVCFEGDATDDQVLRQAGIEHAYALAACLENDKDNLYLVMTARELNKKLLLAAQFNSPASRQKLLNVGASVVVSPNMIGGLRLISEVIRPHVATFFDRMLHSKTEAGLRVEQYTLSDHSVFVGRSIQNFYQTTGLQIIAYQSPGATDFTYNLAPDTPLSAGQTLIFIATPDKRLALEKTS